MYLPLLIVVAAELSSGRSALLAMLLLHGEQRYASALGLKRNAKVFMLKFKNDCSWQIGIRDGSSLKAIDGDAKFNSWHS